MRIRPGLFIGLVLGCSCLGTAQTGSVLQVQSSMMPAGSWLKLPGVVGPTMMTMYPDGDNGIIAYAGNLVWDSTHHRGYFWGNEHSTGDPFCNPVQNPTCAHNATRFIKYDEGTNTWSEVVDTNTGYPDIGIAGQHSNNLLAIDPATGDVYKGWAGNTPNFPSLSKFTFTSTSWNNNVDGGTFTNPQNNPYATQYALPAMVWWPGAGAAGGVLEGNFESGSLMYWDKATNAWSVKSTAFIGNPAQNKYPGMGVYNTVTHTALMNGGCGVTTPDRDQFYIVSYNSGTGAFTPSAVRHTPPHMGYDPHNLATLQFCLDGNSQGSNLSYSSVTGHFIAILRNTTNGDFLVGDYDSVADSWALLDSTAIPTMPTQAQWGYSTIDFSGGHTAPVAIPEYGVIMYLIQAGGGTHETWLFKPTVGGGTPPDLPTALHVTGVSANQVELQWTAPAAGTAVAGYKIYNGATQIGTSTYPIFLAAGLAAGTAYSFNVTAYSSTGAEGSHTGNVSATTDAALLTFAQKCNTATFPGVVKCINWDSQSQMIYNWPTGPEPYCNNLLGTTLGYTNTPTLLISPTAFPYANASAVLANGNCYYPSVDTTMAHSGTGSLKYPVPNHASQSPAGEYTDVIKRFSDGHFGYMGPTTLAPTANAEHLGDDFWVQWYQRFDAGALQKFDQFHYLGNFSTASAGATTVTDIACGIPLDSAGHTVLFQNGTNFTLGTTFPITMVPNSCTMVLASSPTPAAPGNVSGSLGFGYIDNHALVGGQADGWKQFGAFGNLPATTCCAGGTQIAVNLEQQGKPGVYTYNGSGQPITYEQARSGCPVYPNMWDDGTFYTEPPCVRYKPNQWMEFTIHIKPQILGARAFTQIQKTTTVGTYTGNLGLAANNQWIGILASFKCTTLCNIVNQSDANTTQTNTATPAATFQAGNTPGSTFVAEAYGTDTVSIPNSVTDGCGNSYSLVEGKRNGSGSFSMWMATNTSGTGCSPVVAHFPVSNAYPWIGVFELTGTTASPLDQHVSNTGTSASIVPSATTGNITTTVATEILISAGALPYNGAMDAQNSFTTDSGYTEGPIQHYPSGAPVSLFEQWVDGQKTQDRTDFTYVYGANRGASGNGFGSFNLLWYPTQKDPNQDTGSFALHYDDMIFSTQPIPMGSVPSGTVSPDNLVFTSQPTDLATGSNFSPTVAVTAQLSGGGTDTAFSGNVTLNINGCGAAPSGLTTVTVSAGVATFTGLGATTVTTAPGCQFTASATGANSGLSNTFNVTTGVIVTSNGGSGRGMLRAR